MVSYENKQFTKNNFYSKLVFFNILCVLWISFSQFLWSSGVVLVMPLRDTPAWNPVHCELTKPLQDSSLPLPTEEYLDSIQYSNLEFLKVLLAQTNDYDFNFLNTAIKK